MFNSIPELYDYVHSTVHLDVSRFRPRILELGDIYRANLMALYCARTGKWLTWLDGTSYWVDRRGKRVPVMSVRDVEMAGNDIHHSHGGLVIPYNQIQRMQFTSTQPVSAKAQRLVQALAIDGLQNELDHVTVSRSLSSVQDLVDYQILDRIHGAERVMLQVKNAVVIDSIRRIEKITDYEWRSVHIQMDHRRGELMLEVGMDIRIREYYETRLRDEAERQAQADNGPDDVFSILR